MRRGNGLLLVVAVLMGLAAASLSFSAPGRNQRKSLRLAGGVGVLFVVGWVFSDIWPVATVVRAQLFRSSRLLVVLISVLIPSSWSVLPKPVRLLPPIWLSMTSAATALSRVKAVAS